MELLARITEETHALLLQAQDEGRSLGNGYVGTEHLVVAALASGSGEVARELLRNGASADAMRAEIARLAGENNWTKYVPPETALDAIGVDLSAVRRETEAEFGEGSLPMRTGAPPLTARAMRLVEASVEAARAHGRDEASPDDVIRAVLRDADSIAVRVLTSFGIDVAAIL